MGRGREKWRKRDKQERGKEKRDIEEERERGKGGERWWLKCYEIQLKQHIRRACAVCMHAARGLTSLF